MKHALALLIAMLVAPLADPRAAEPPKAKPHILLIIADELAEKPASSASPPREAL